MYDLQHEYRHTILHRIHHKHLKWYETPEEFKEINEKPNLSEIEDERSQNDFGGFDKEDIKSIFKINWEKVSKFKIQLQHNLEQVNQDSQNQSGSQEVEVRIPQNYATYNMEPWIHDELNILESVRQIPLIDARTSNIWRDLVELEGTVSYQMDLVIFRGFDSKVLRYDKIKVSKKLR
ncbi:UNVERIFIED_CONTAM: hypothetical protein RMT77_013824 [Armadillidium vulgare]